MASSARLGRFVLSAYVGGVVTGNEDEPHLAFAASNSWAKSSSNPNGEFNCVCNDPREQSEQFAAFVDALPAASHENVSSSQYLPDDASFRHERSYV